MVIALVGGVSAVMVYRRLAIALLLVLLLPSGVLAAWHSDTQPIMGTEVSVTLWHKSKTQADTAIAAVMADMERINQQFSPYIETSELYRANHNAATQPVTISSEFSQLLKAAHRISELTEGAFDITFASVGHLYDYRQQKQPSVRERNQRLDAIDYRLVKLHGDKLSFGDSRVVIDLGGIAKGYAVDRAIAILTQHGIEHASVSAGGDSRVLGDRLGRDWHVGIKDPRNNDAVAIMFPISNAAVSTSGDYERFFIDKRSGERVHHIINPRSGTAVKGIASVTIIGEQGLQTDPLSTSVFVMGVDKGLALVDRLPGVDAIIIDARGKVFYSEGLQPPSQKP